MKDEKSKNPVNNSERSWLSRRSFLDVVFSGSILLTVVVVLGAIVKFITPREAPAIGRRRALVGNLDQIPVGGSVRRVLRGQGVLVIRTRTSFAGLSLNCTHKGCNVEWDEERGMVVCPCHGGYFDLQGNVLGGPPPRPLKRFEVKVIEERVYIED